MSLEFGRVICGEGIILKVVSIHLVFTTMRLDESTNEWTKRNVRKRRG